MKRQLSEAEYRFLTNEINYCQAEGIISSEQKQAVLDLYQVKEGLNFIKVVVTIGAILIGLGILSFIASNWNGMTKLTKLAIIFASYLTANIAAFKEQNNHPKTSKSLLYLGILIYGAGIFLIGQMFNFGGEFADAFLLWSLGIVPLALQQNDKYIMLFANLLFAIYFNATANSEFPYLAYLAIPALYLAVRYYGNSRLLLFFANLTTLNFILYLSLRYDLPALYIAAIFFVIGIAMYLIKHNFEYLVFRLQGNVLLGIAGVALTIPDIWSKIASTHTLESYYSTGFALFFVVLLLASIRKGSLISLVFICVTIFRYYVDTFQFLPKSLFFIFGGLILLGFGYYFERMRKAGKESDA